MRSLQLIDNRLINLERLGQYISVYCRIRTENRISNGDNTRILTAQKCDCDGIPLPNVLLKVNKPQGENKHVSLLKDFGNQPVLRVGRDEAHEHSALQHRQYLGSSRVAVGRNHSSRTVVDSHGGDAEGVEARNFEHGWAVYEGAEGIWGVSRYVKPSKKEVIRGHLLRV